MSNFDLTPREKEIVELLICGYSNQEISEKLSISKNTTKLHLLNVYKKLDVDNRLSATLKYIANCDDSEQKLFELAKNFSRKNDE